MRKMSEAQMAEVRATGRYRLLGEQVASAKLTERMVREIRRAYGPVRGDMRRRHRVGHMTLAELALAYGVSKDAIHRVVQRKTWSHI